MSEDEKQRLGKEGLPGEQADNGEEQGPTEPSRRRPGTAEGGDSDAGGESKEGTQSTGNPDSAG